MSVVNPQPPDSRSQRLLIVEDDAATRFALSRILSFSGYHVTTAATLASALLKCDEHTCVLLDLHLPDGLGLEVLRRIREKRPHTRVAICSAAHDLELRRKVEQYHPDAIFIKPIDLDALLAWVREACQVMREGTPAKGVDAAPNRADA